MNDHQALTAKQSRAIRCLLEASSLEEGCKRARVGKATVYRWLREDAFRSELETRRREIVEVAVIKALQILVKQLDSEKGTMSIRAAESIIEFARRGIERRHNKERLPRQNESSGGLLSEDLTKKLEDARERRRLALHAPGVSLYSRHDD